MRSVFLLRAFNVDTQKHMKKQPVQIWVNLLLYGIFFTIQKFRKILDEVVAAGGTGVEIPVLAGNVIDYTEFGDEAKSRKLKVSAVGMVDARHDPSSFNPKVRMAALEYIKLQICRAAAAGASALVGPYGLPWKKRPKGKDGKLLVGDALVRHIKGRLKNAIPVLREAADFAAELGIVIYVEGLKGWELAGLNHLQEVVDFVALIGHPNVGILDDTCHETSDGLGPQVYKAQITRALLSGIKIWKHASATGQRGDITETWIQWPIIFGILKDIGWEGPIVLEMFDAEEPFASGACINRVKFTNRPVLLRKCIAFLQREWKEAPDSWSPTPYGFSGKAK